MFLAKLLTERTSTLEVSIHWLQVAAACFTNLATFCHVLATGDLILTPAQAPPLAVALQMCPNQHGHMQFGCAHALAVRRPPPRVLAKTSSSYTMHWRLSVSLPKKHVGNCNPNNIIFGTIIY
jgi:hypothetical protein